MSRDGFKVACTVGARPNFIKMAPLMRVLEQRGADVVCIHTGQHSDPRMSRNLMLEIQMREPDYDLGLGGAGFDGLTEGLSAVLGDLCPDLVVTAGDVDSTLACALAAASLRLPLAHLESGLRCGDRSMREETNRITVDHLSDFLFATEESAVQNLIKEGISPERIFFAGNTMIDTLLRCKKQAEFREPWKQLSLSPGEYILLTLHRPENVDESGSLSEIFSGLASVAGKRLVVFPAHPRTRARMESFGLKAPAGVFVIEPAGYLDFIGWMLSARLVMTDSGGVQEEAAALGLPCLTLRPSTERPLTVSAGMNHVCGPQPSAFVPAALKLAAQPHYFRDRGLPELWDGRAGERIADILERKLAEREKLEESAFRRMHERRK